MMGRQKISSRRVERQCILLLHGMVIMQICCNAQQCQPVPPKPPGVQAVDCSRIPVPNQAGSAKLGVNVWRYFFESQPDRAIDVTAEMGIRWAKVLVPWSLIESSDPNSADRQWVRRMPNYAPCIRADSLSLYPFRSSLHGAKIQTPALRLRPAWFHLFREMAHFEHSLVLLYRDIRLCRRMISW